MTDAWPTELRLAEAGRVLKITFDNGAAFAIPAELLRVESPSAEVKGHGPGQETLVTGKRDITITHIDPIGAYAVKLTFSDGHSTGIFTWAYLNELGRDQTKIWNAYLAKLAAAGETR